VGLEHKKFRINDDVDEGLLHLEIVNHDLGKGIIQASHHTIFLFFSYMLVS